MRADVGIMLGVVGLGLFALFKMGKAEGDAPAPAPKPGEDGPQLAFLGDPLAFRQLAWYRGRLNLPAIPGPLSATATDEAIGQALVGLGFQDVRVFSGVAELPAGWPASTAMNPGAGTRWFQGQWKGPSVSVARPPYVEQVWSTRPPTPATSGMRG